MATMDSDDKSNVSLSILYTHRAYCHPSGDVLLVGDRGVQFLWAVETQHTHAENHAIAPFAASFKLSISAGGECVENVRNAADQTTPAVK